MNPIETKESVFIINAAVNILNKCNLINGVNEENVWYWLKYLASITFS